MSDPLSAPAKEAFEQCELAKSVTGATPETGTRCWLFVQDEQGRLNKKCEKCVYRNALIGEEGVVVRESGQSYIVTLMGALSDAHVASLKSALDQYFTKDKALLLLDCSTLKSVPERALGLIIRTYKTVKEKGRDLFLMNVQPGFRYLLEETRLIRILTLCASIEEAETHLKRREEALRTGEAKAKEEKKQKLIVQAQSVRCWDYFKGRHPKNATTCLECHYKISGAKRPCWIIMGNIDGVTFEYIDEACTSCPFFLEFNPEGNLEIRW